MILRCSHVAVMGSDEALQKARMTQRAMDPQMVTRMVQSGPLEMQPHLPPAYYQRVLSSCLLPEWIHLNPRHPWLAVLKPQILKVRT